MPGKLESYVTALSNHAIGYCKCITPSTAYLVASCSKYYLFLLTTKSNVAQVIDEELVSCKSLSDCGEDKAESDQFVGSALKNASRFDGSVLPHIVIWKRQEQLLEPLDQMLKFIGTAAESKFSRDDIRTFHIQDNLRTAFYVYKLYRVVNNQHKCASLIEKLSCSSSDTLRSFYFRMSIALQLGDIELALMFRDSAQKYDVTKNTETSLNIDSTLFFYLSVETDLRKGIDRGECLQTFISSPAVQKVTVNRYFLRIVGLILASKFPGNYGYRHNKYFKEMLEPLCMSLYMVKRWNKKLEDLKSQAKMNSDELLDPLWMRYAVYNIFFESYVTTSSFYCNSGNPSELTFFHEASIRLCREYCLLYWLRKILIIASDVDILMDKHEFAHHKLTNALELIDHESPKMHVPIGARKSDPKAIIDEELDWKLSTIKLDMYRNEEQGCLHERNVIPWNVEENNNEEHI